MTLLKQSTKKTDIEIDVIQSKYDKLIIDKDKRDECSKNNEKFILKMFKICENIGKILIVKSRKLYSFDIIWMYLKLAVVLWTLCSVQVNAGLIRDDEDVGPCLLGSFTQVQSWVQEDGSLSQKLSKTSF